MIRAHRLLAAAIVLTTAVGVTGCSTTVALEPADAANNPLCAAVTVRLPDEVDGQSRNWTDAQATGAWGSPSTVILSCGVTPPGPTTDQCLEVGGVEWVFDDSASPNVLATTFGREPAVQVLMDNKVVSPDAVLDTIGKKIDSVLPGMGGCI